jgi:two-component system cell cycle response regulator DivK
LLVAVAMLLCVPPVPAREQPARRPFRIGVINAAYAASHPTVEGLKAGLKELGIEDTRDVTFDIRFTEGKLDAMPAAAEALVKAGVDLIFTSQEAATLAAKEATKSVPIVFTLVGDPVGAGIVSKLAQPGGNHRGRPAEDLRGVPTGRQLQHPHEGRHRARTLDLPAHCGAARRAPLGGVDPRGRIDVLFHRATARRTAGGASMSKRILVIEDHEENRRILRILLASAGFEMIEAVTGEEGVAAAERERPDLILMDIQLPGLDGYEATRRIKANPALRHIPVIVVTSYALSGDDVKAFEAGCDAYVTKPFVPRQLLAKVRQYLAPPTESPA